MFTNKQTNKHYQRHTLALALSLDQSGLYQLDNLHERMYSLNYERLTPKLSLHYQGSTLINACCQAATNVVD